MGRLNSAVSRQSSTYTFLRPAVVWEMFLGVTGRGTEYFVMGEKTGWLLRLLHQVADGG